MKSTEIRRARAELVGKKPEDTQSFFLAEIAAQVAELNENYQEFKRLFTTDGCIDVRGREV